MTDPSIWEPGTLTVLISGIVGIITAIVAGAIKIIKEIRGNTVITTAVGEAQRTSAVVRDQKLEQIHTLVNGRLVAALQGMVEMTRKEAQRTGLITDVQAYQQAVDALIRAELTKDTHDVETKIATHEAEAAALEVQALTKKDS